MPSSLTMTSGRCDIPAGTQNNCKHANIGMLALSTHTTRHAFYSAT